MQTSKWGPVAWDTFFMFSRNYPETCNVNNAEHARIRRYTKQFYSCLSYVLPCKYCRESYKQFWKQLPIDEYLGGRNDLTLWLYRMKDLVNRKLIAQEQRLFEKKLGSLAPLNRNSVAKLKKEIFFTKPTPSFDSIVRYYDKFRADCSPETKSCRTLKKK